jgi:mRNA-degrading endonuclease YafQ of YafQ-DinJ toxin-antitoxin module
VRDPEIDHDVVLIFTIDAHRRLLQLYAFQDEGKGRQLPADSQ